MIIVTEGCEGTPRLAAEWAGRWRRVWERLIVSLALMFAAGYGREANSAAAVDVELRLRSTMSPAELEVQRRRYAAALH
ncbi:hypothetical protein X739_11890 [Mesorhizobium sp. LNHC220B00]|nr:hypothetical protein X739_11890 [Mesorhizobium sp. LNHC220B00]